MKWEEIPIVRFVKLLEQQKWYKLCKGVCSVHSTNPGYNPIYSSMPTNVRINLTYGDEIIQLEMSHDSVKYVYRPKSKRTKNPGRRAVWAKRTKDVYKALEIMAEDFENLLDEKDEAEANRIRQETYEKRCNALCTEVAKQIGFQNPKMTNIGSPELCDDTGEETPIDMSFRCYLSKRYSVSFMYDENSNTPMSFDIQGEFTTDEAKQVLSLISGMPSVMADRIKNGK